MLAPATLIDARLQLHHAAQIPAAFAAALIEGRPDDSHTSFHWEQRSGWLITAAASGYRAALRVADLTLCLVDARGDTLRSLSLLDETVGTGLTWLEAASRELLGTIPSLVPPSHELPPHTVSKGAKLGPSPAALDELTRWYDLAQHALERVAAAHDLASPLRCWPHHLDIATLIELSPEAPSETLRSVGAGLSPGDGDYPEPYFYVTPWPYPREAALPALPAGHFHRQGWFAAVLTATELSSSGTGARQDRVASFLDTAIPACIPLAGA